MARFLELRHLLWAYPCGDNGVAPSTWTVGSNTKNVFGAKCKIAIFFSDLQQKIVLESGIVDGATPNCRQLSTIDGANHMHGKRARCHAKLTGTGEKICEKGIALVEGS